MVQKVRWKTGSKIITGIYQRCSESAERLSRLDCPDSKKAVRPKNMMDKPEWMIDEYKLEDWYSTTYKGNDLKKKCCPTLKSSYRGILRV